MLNIESRCVAVDVCANCGGSGVALPAMRKLLTDYGAFCECAIGREKWEATNKIATRLEETLAAMPPVPLPPLSLPVPRKVALSSGRTFSAR